MRRPGLILAMMSLPLLAAAADETPLPRDRQTVLDRQLRGLTPLGTQSCIQRSRIRDIYVITDNRLLFKVSRNLVYENHLLIGCPGLARSPYLPQPPQSLGTELCAGDLMVEVDDGATCALGQFTVWRPAAAASD